MSKARDRKALEEEQGQTPVNSDISRLKTCPRHPKVRYDGAECPACQAEREFLALTDSEI
jgi:hypothetical protein